MNKHLIPAALALCLGSAALAVQAESFTSSASSASSASVGSLSTSVERSSASSTGGNKVAEGEYRITTLAAAPLRPGHVRLTLQALADGSEFQLTVPEAVASAAALAPQGIVAVKQRAYGLEFGRAGAAFFLALSDDWYRDMQTRLVTL